MTIGGTPTIRMMLQNDRNTVIDGKTVMLDHWDHAITEWIHIDGCIPARWRNLLRRLLI
jgi:hypothetical protein